MRADLILSIDQKTRDLVAKAKDILDQHSEDKDGFQILALDTLSPTQQIFLRAILDANSFLSAHVHDYDKRVQSLNEIALKSRNTEILEAAIAGFEEAAPATEQPGASAPPSQEKP